MKRFAASDIKTRVKRLLKNPTNNPDMPERHERELPLIGRTQVTDTHVIALQYDSRTNYKAYFSIQNQLREAYRELRETGTQPISTARLMTLPSNSRK